MKKSEICCPVCGGNDRTQIYTAFDDRYGHPGIFNIERCNVCDHIMTLPQLAESALPELYRTYYPRKDCCVGELVGEVSNVARFGEKLLRWWTGTDNQGQYLVRDGDTILDVGCGNGKSLLEAQALGARAFGIEADPNVRRIADELGLQVHIGSLYDHPFPDQQFDMIILNQVIEHMPEPAQILIKLKERLKSDGRIILTFPNRASLWSRLTGKKWINWHIPYHLHHFDAKSFEVLARCVGYRVIRLKTVTPNIWTVLQLRVLVQASVTPGIPSLIWAVKPAVSMKASRSATRIRPSRLLRAIALSILSPLNRLIDIFGYGDSVLVELQVRE